MIHVLTNSAWSVQNNFLGAFETQTCHIFEREHSQFTVHRDVNIAASFHTVLSKKLISPRGYNSATHFNFHPINTASYQIDTLIIN